MMTSFISLFLETPLEAIDCDADLMKEEERYFQIKLGFFSEY